MSVKTRVLAISLQSEVLCLLDLGSIPIGYLGRQGAPLLGRADLRVSRLAAGLPRHAWRTASTRRALRLRPRGPRARTTRAGCASSSPRVTATKSSYSISRIFKADRV